MRNLKDMLAREPVLVINAVVALATLAAGYGLDVDPEGIGAALGALLVLAGITRSNVWAPDSVDKAEAEARASVLEAIGSAEALAYEERKAQLKAEGYNVSED